MYSLHKNGTQIGDSRFFSRCTLIRNSQLVHSNPNIKKNPNVWMGIKNMRSSRTGENFKENDKHLHGSGLTTVHRQRGSNKFHGTKEQQSRRIKNRLDVADLGRV